MIKKNDFSTIISLIGANEWDKAKTIWVLIVCRMKPNDELCFSLFNTEFEAFIKHFIDYQAVQFYCENCKKKI